MAILPPNSVETPPLDSLGRFRLHRKLATGGMGEVFLASQEGPAGFSKPVVVKRVLGRLASDPHFIQLFLKEARIAALLSHPNIVQVFELGEDQGTYFIAMEYIHGHSLSAVRERLRARAQRLPVSLAVRICLDALKGLHHAHTVTSPRGEPLNIVHCDVSPDNILIGFDGTVKVVDFGIARAGAVGHHAEIRGKAPYMAPEQLENPSISPRVDVYGAGVVLYELLSGHRPYEERGRAQLLERMRQSGPRPLRSVAPEIDSTLASIVETAIAVQPSLRFETAKEMTLRLREWAEQKGEREQLGMLEALMEELFKDSSKLLPIEPPQLSTRSFAGPAEAATLVASSAQVTEVAAGPTEQPPAPKLPGLKPRRILLASLSASVLVLFAILVTKLPSPPRPSVDTASLAAEANAPSSSPAPPDQAPLAEASTASSGTPPVATAPVKREQRAASTPGPKQMKPSARPTPVQRASPPAPKKTGGWGTIRVRVHPWAEVWWKGKSYGTTPIKPLQVPAGEHELLLRNPELGVERRVVTTVQAGGSAEVTLNLLAPPAGTSKAASQ